MIEQLNFLEELSSDRIATERSQYYRKNLKIQETISRYQSVGIDGFSDCELLEAILNFLMPRKDNHTLSSELINKYGTLAGVMEADCKDLLSDTTHRSVLFLSMMPALTRRYLASRLSRNQKATKLTSPETAKEYLESLLVGLTVELFYVLCLDSQCRVLNPVRVSQGTLDRAVVEIREVVREALRNKAHSVIMAHNHPAGRAEPSVADRELTKLLVKGLTTVGIPVRDHLIIATDDWFSFAQAGILDQ